MTRLPTLYIRNVPTEVYEALKARAKREGRSVNAEALEILEDVAEQEPDPRVLVAELWELSREFKRLPGDPDAEETMRILRDSGEEALERQAAWRADLEQSSTRTCSCGLSSMTSQKPDRGSNGSPTANSA